MSDLSFIPNSLQGIILGFQYRLQGIIQPGTTWTLDPGVTKIHGALGNGGTLELLPDARLYLDGDPVIEEGFVQWGGSQTYLHGTSRLVSSFQPVLIQGGVLATVWASDVSSGTARIVSATVKITGGDIYVSMQQGAHVNSGELIIAGTLEWLGGTFHPYVYADGVTTDVLRQSDEVTVGNFTINGGVVDPIYIDSDYGVSSSPHSSDSWIILQATGGFTTNTAPTLTNNLLWSMQIDPVPVGSKKFWRLIAN